MSLASSMRAVQRFAGPRGARCDLCAGPLADDHEHLVDLHEPSLVCTCRACATLFDGTASERFRRVTSHVARLDDPPTAAEWDALGIPVGTVAVVLDRAGDVAALYPGAAGVVRGRVAREDWNALVAARPSLRALEPDVEALLVHLSPNEPPAFFQTGVDACFRLVGLLRRAPAGTADASVRAFFARLAEEAA